MDLQQATNMGIDAGKENEQDGQEWIIDGGANGGAGRALQVGE